MNKLTKIAIAACTLFALGAPSAFAAYNDVTLTTDTVLSVNDITLNITGDSATIQSITVDSTSFTVSLAAGSSIIVTSSDRKVLAVNQVAEHLLTIDTCTATESKIKLESQSSGPDVTITPSSSTCVGQATIADSSSGSGGGGGGGGGSNDDDEDEEEEEEDEGTAAPTSQAPSSTPGTSASGSVGASVSFTRALTVGVTGEDVMALQKILNSDPATQIAATGPGSPGNETEYFGALTEAAVKKFQEKHGIAKAGDPGYGFVGPKTRAKLMELGGGASVGVSTNASSAGLSSEDSAAQIKAIMDQIAALQAQLDAMEP